MCLLCGHEFGFLAVRRLILLLGVFGLIMCYVFDGFVMRKDQDSRFFGSCMNLDEDLLFFVMFCSRYFAD